MVNERTVLQVLACVGEVEAEEFGIGAFTGEADVGVQPDDLAAKGHRDVLVHGVLGNLGVVLGQVACVVFPELDGDHGQLGAFADDDLHVAVVVGGTVVFQDHHGAAVRAGLDDDGACWCGGLRPLPVIRTRIGSVQFGVRGDDG